jgi:DNA-binding transcriptional ArsR family regulator
VVDQLLVDRLYVLGRALGNPLRVRVAAEFIVRDEASPAEVAEALGEPLGSVAYHVRVLGDLGFLELRRMIPVRGALQHVYRVATSLRTAFPATAHALNERPTSESAPVPDEAFDQFAPAVPMKVTGTLNSHTLTRFGWALSHDLRISILDQLLRRAASTQELASALGASPALVGRHVRQLATMKMVKPSRRTSGKAARGHRWTVGPETKKALRGLGDYLALHDAEPDEERAGRGAS